VVVDAGCRCDSVEVVGGEVIVSVRLELLSIGHAARTSMLGLLLGCGGGAGGVGVSVCGCARW